MWIYRGCAYIGGDYREGRLYIQGQRDRFRKRISINNIEYNNEYYNDEYDDYDDYKHNDKHYNKELRTNWNI